MGQDEVVLEGGTAADPDGGQTAASRGCGVVGCVLVIAVLVGLGLGAAALTGAVDPFFDRFRSPADVVREYMLSFEDGDRERAVRFLCADLRVQVEGGPLPDPVAALETEGSWRWSGVEDEFPYPRPDGRIAIYYQIDQPGTGAARRAQALLVDEDGWRICGFEP